MSDRRKREIRKLMAETGMNYTRSAQEVERQRSVDAQSAADPIEASPASAEIQRAVQEHVRHIAEIQRQAERANAHCIDGQADVASKRITDARHPARVRTR